MPLPSVQLYLRQVQAQQHLRLRKLSEIVVSSHQLFVQMLVRDLGIGAAVALLQRHLDHNTECCGNGRVGNAILSQ